MSIGDLFSSFKQETAQVFLVACGALYLFWKGGAPEYLLWIVGGLAGLFIAGEKVRVMVRPDKASPPA